MYPFSRQSKTVANRMIKFWLHPNFIYKWTDDYKNYQRGTNIVYEIPKMVRPHIIITSSKKGRENFTPCTISDQKTQRKRVQRIEVFREQRRPQGRRIFYHATDIRERIVQITPQKTHRRSIT